MRRAARVDANQAEIVEVLRAVGASVWITSSIGDGGPDIVVGYRGRNFLYEIKDGEKYASKTRLTADEREFHESWHGIVFIVRSVDEAIAARLVARREIER